SALSGLLALCPRFVFFPDVLQELLDALPAVDGLVVDEAQLGHEAQPQRLTQLPADESGGSLETRGGVGLGALVAVDRVVRRGLPQIGADLHSGECDEADARILETARGEAPQLLLDQLTHSLGTIMAHDKRRTLTAFTSAYHP